MKVNLLTINQIAKLLCVHHSTSKRFLERLQLQPVEIACRQYYRTSDVWPHLKAVLELP
jgi:transposase